MHACKVSNILCTKYVVVNRHAMWSRIGTGFHFLPEGLPWWPSDVYYALVNNARGGTSHLPEYK